MKYIVRSSSFTSRSLPIEMGEPQYRKLLAELKQNPNTPIVISSLLPESRQQRRYLEGGLIPLFVFFQGNDYTDLSVIKDAREDIMREVLGYTRYNMVRGVTEKYALSSKGRDNLNKVCEWLLDYLVVNFQCPDKALDPETFKWWKDVELMKSAPDVFIDYLLELNILKKPV